jgi:SAM-dependent methyltransferase
MHRSAGAERRYRYLLGDSRREAVRLRAQARLWDPTAAALFDRLRVRRGWKVLEIGPGQGSLHLELRRRVRGPVDAVERSHPFAARLRVLCGRDGWGPGRIWESDLLDAPLPRGRYDLIFARWVFLFLPDPGAHLRKLAGALKPGGLLAIEDYHRETFALVPRPPGWGDLLAADRAFYASQGGDVSVGGRLPDLYRRAGLEVVEIVPTIKVGRPGSPVWKWLSDYFLGVMDRLADCPPLTPAKAARLRRRWLAAARRKTSLMIAPAVLDVVGRKPRR